MLDPDGELVAGTAWLFARDELDGDARHARRRRGRTVQPCRRDRERYRRRGGSSSSAIPSSSPRSRRASTRRIRRERARARARRARDRSPRRWASSSSRPAACTRRSAASSRRRSTRGGSARSRSARERTTSDGVGVRWLGRRHEGNRVDSEEEADAIAAEIERLMGHTFSRRAGERPLRHGDVMVVAPYNAQVRLAARAAPATASRSGRSTSSRAAKPRSSSTRWPPRAVRTFRAGSTSCCRATASTSPSRGRSASPTSSCSPRLLEVDCRTVEHVQARKRALPLRRAGGKGGRVLTVRLTATLS